MKEYIICTDNDKLTIDREIIHCENCRYRDGCWCQWFNFELLDFTNYCSFAEYDIENSDQEDWLDELVKTWISNRKDF